MRIPIPIKCPNCGRKRDVFIGLDEHEISSVCECGRDISAVLANFTVGQKLLERSRYEFVQNCDYSLTIVFAATAMECEVSRLYFKWKRANALFYQDVPTDEELEEALRKLPNIADRIDEVAKLMHPAGLHGFIASDPELVKMISIGFSKLDLSNLSTSFQKVLYWPRNRILHLGYSKYDSAEATYCYNTAALGIHLLNLLDQTGKAAS